MVPIMMNVMIDNFPQSAAHRKWIVCRAVDGAVWFYGAWRYDERMQADEQARAVDGFVVENTTWLKGIFDRP